MKQFSEAFGRKLEGTGITRIQWICLYYLSEVEEISQRELSNLMHVKDSSIGRLIDRLERDGIVVRNRSKKDRRVIKISLSEKGKETFKKLCPLGEEFNNILIKDISKEDMNTFEKVLKTMLKNINNDVQGL